MVSKPLLIISENSQKTGKLSEVKCLRSCLLETHRESEICMHVYFFPLSFLFFCSVLLGIRSMREWMEEALGLCEATEASVNPTGKSGARRISRVISVEALGIIPSPLNQYWSTNEWVGVLQTRGNNNVWCIMYVSWQVTQLWSCEESAYPVDGGMSFSVL